MLRWLGATSSVAVVIVNLSATVFTILATCWIARRCGLSAKWCRLAAAIPALDPLLIRYTAMPMTEVLSTALLTAAILCAIGTLPLPGSVGRRLRSAALAGVFFGLAGLCRPIAFVACAGVSLLVAFRLLLLDRATPLRDRVLRSLILPCTAACVLAPWVVRNRIQLDHWIPATTHGGYTLLLGNNPVFYDEVVLAEGQPVWTGESRAAWQADLDADMAAQQVDIHDEVEVDRWLNRRARDVIAADRSTFLQACLLRWKRFWSLTPSVSSGRHSGVIEMGSGIWYAALFLCLPASLLFGNHRRANVQLLWIAIPCFLLIHTFYWTNTRMRAPLIGVFSVLAVIGLQSAFGVLRKSRSCEKTDEAVPRADAS